MRFTRPLLLGSLLLLPLLAAAQGDQQFVPLLPSLPGIDTLQQGDSLAVFLTQIYKICIGLAAVLAVLQLMRAGVMYMGGDSITEKKEARNLIAVSIAGLLLVLAPVIVFSIINPKILNLDINVSSIKTEVANMEPPLNDLGQTSNAKNDAGGGTIAPAPTAKGCTYITPNSQILATDDQPTNQQVMCCGSQSNAFASCEVRQRNSKTSDGTFHSVSYCGCSITAASMDYYTYELKTVYENSVKSIVDKGVVPDQIKAHDDYVAGCAAAGGKLTTSTKGIFTAAGTCPAGHGISSDKTYTTEGKTNSYTQYLCTPMTAECKTVN